MAEDKGPRGRDACSCWRPIITAVPCSFGGIAVPISEGEESVCMGS
jgi:hypothetical protein